MPDASPQQLSIRELTERDFPRWDAFVMATPEATFFHRAGWKRVLEGAFGHRTHFLYAERNGQIEGILPTLLDTRTVHAKEAIEILEENFGDRVFASRIRKTIRFAEAPVQGMSVLKYDPDGVAAQSYRDLAKEVLSNG